MTDYDKLRELAEAAHPVAYTWMSRTPEDAQFIAATKPSVVLALLDELRELRARITYLEEAL